MHRGPAAARGEATAGPRRPDSPARCHYFHFPRRCLREAQILIKMKDILKCRFIPSETSGATIALKKSITKIAYEIHKVVVF